MVLPEITYSLPNSQNIARIVLDNGIVVLVYENMNTQSVVIEGSLRGGSLHETPEKSGLAALTSSALMRGTQHRDFDAIHSELEDIGADLGVGAGVHRVSFDGKALAEDLDVLLDVLNDVLRFPTFPDDQVERLRGEAMTWLQYQQQDTRRQAGRLFREHLYPGSHPYHYSSRGTLETVPNLTIDEMRAFHASQYGPDGMTICIVGAVGVGAAIEIVNEKLGQWRNPGQSEKIELPPLEPLADIRRAGMSIPGKTQSDIIMGVVGPARSAPDYQAANLANSVLGQFGMMGRIGDVVREQSGMAYYAYSRLDGGLGPGAWSIAAGVNPVNVERAIELSLGEAKRLTTELIEDSDLDDNKSYYVGRLPLQLESNDGIAGTILTLETYDLGLDYLVGYRDMINALTKEQLLAAAQHYWTPDAYVVSVAGPDAK